MLRRWLPLVAAVVVNLQNSRPARACSCGRPFARLVLPAPVDQQLAVPSFPLLVEAPSREAFRIEDTWGTPVALGTITEMPRLGLCTTPTYLVATAAPLDAGTRYRLVPLPAPGDDPASVAGHEQTFGVAAAPARAIVARAAIEAAVIEHDPPITPEASLCADPRLSGRALSRTLTVTVTTAPVVDLLVTASVDDPSNGATLADSSVVLAVAWGLSDAEPARVELPAYDGADGCAAVVVRDLRGDVVFSERLCPAAGAPERRTFDVTAPEPPEDNFGGDLGLRCSACGGRPRPAALVLLALAAAGALRRGRPRAPARAPARAAAPSPRRPRRGG